MNLIRRLRGRSIRYLLTTRGEHIYQLMMTRFWTGVFRIKSWFYRVKCGRNPEIFGNVLIRSQGGEITIGDNVQLISSSWRCTASSLNHPVRLRTFLPSARIILEDGVGLNGTSITCRSKTIRIGKGTMIGPNCVIVDSDFHRPWPPEMRRVYTGDECDSDVCIGRNVWIGANCMVLKGVIIGDNSVVAAGSVVVKTIPENVLAAGNPARVIKHYVS